MYEGQTDRDKLVMSPSPELLGTLAHPTAHGSRRRERDQVGAWYYSLLSFKPDLQRSRAPPTVNFPSLQWSCQVRNTAGRRSGPSPRALIEGTRLSLRGLPSGVHKTLGPAVGSLELLEPGLPPRATLRGQGLPLPPQRWPPVETSLQVLSSSQQPCFHIAWALANSQSLLPKE